MSVSEKIKTVKTIYPQIYAYTLPDINSKDGWVKIGYTERENVDSRILEQTRTAAIKLNYDKLWSGPAKFNNSDGWFKDYQLHSYLIKQKHREQEKGSEWFYYNGYPDKSYSDYLDYCNFKINQESEQMDYQLRFEQEEAIKKTLSYMKKYKGNEELKFLWNAKPRFGKTLTTYDLARRLNASRVLIVTNRPAIANSWYDDFEKFIAWQTDYAFVSTTDSLKDRPVLEREDFVRQLCSENGKKSLISFISLQDLKGAIDFGGPYQKLAWVKDLEWDLLVIDESHEGVDTIKTDVAFRKIKSRFSLYLSGTPFKAIASGDFREDQIFNWSYADEQKAKQNWKDSNKNNPYKNLPQLNMFTYKMSEMITEEVNKGADIDGENVDYAFDLNEFFSTNDDGSFVYESDVIKWLDSLTTREKYPFSTSKLRNELKHTFWLLNRVASAKALEKLLKTHKTFSDYKVILAAGDGRSTDDQIINEKSLERVRKAINKYERTITLSVGQLTTGVTVPEWTGVLMLTNIKSPSLYMQAAFRAQNSWVYEENGQMKQKQNAYIFDFSPERTLIIYDEFANNLNAETVSGSGTTDDRENNIKTLLNFFPVIAEDEDGSMVELDVTKVLTIPKTIKAREVVRRGFMSNFLFQNVSGVFSSEKAREILEKLEPVERGKNKTRKTDEKIDTLGIEVNELGIVKIDEDELKNTVEAKFGKKIYKDFDYTYEALEKNSKVSSVIETNFTNIIFERLKEVAKENKITSKVAKNITKEKARVLGREIEILEEAKKIDERKAEVDLERKVAEAKNDKIKIQKAKDNYEANIKIIENEFKEDITGTIDTKTDELVVEATKDVLMKSTNKKKNFVEEKIRTRLRGFARTIPSFLMAFGNEETTLQNFDKTIKDEVFIEVTGISLDDFRVLRDEYEFFDEVVFNQSIKEFINLKDKLSNYFDKNQEDIFDYIPLQRTNQVYTPRKVVVAMLDSLATDDPNIFRDKDKTFSDLYMKSGLYITEIVKRLYVGLENVIPDHQSRLRHILENQVYGFAPSEIIYHIAKNFIFGFDKEANYFKKSSIVYLDTIPFVNGESEVSFSEKCIELFGGDMKFDFIVGNPPYQENDNGIRDNGKANASASPLYHLFFELAKKQANEKFSLIFPARWLTGAGKGLSTFTKKMMSDTHIKTLTIFNNSRDVFPNHEIKGGVLYLIYDQNYNGPAEIEIYEGNNKYNSHTGYLDSCGINVFIPYKELISIFE